MIIHEKRCGGAAKCVKILHQRKILLVGSEDNIADEIEPVTETDVEPQLVESEEEPEVVVEETEESSSESVS